MNDLDLPVDDHMLTAVRTIRDNARLSAAARLLEELGVSALPVQDSSARLTGVLEGTDLKRASRFQGRGPDGSPRWAVPDGFVAEWMRTVVPIVSRGQPLRECARRMVERGVRHLYVVDDRELCGLLGTREVMSALARARLETPLSDLVRPAGTVAASAPTSVASSELANGKERPLVVLDGDVPVGVFGRSEMLAGLEASHSEATELWMDRAVLVLPAATPVFVAAEKALAAHARYVIARSTASGEAGRERAVFHVITTLTFAACIAGERASAIPPAPIMSEPPLAGGPPHVVTALPSAASDDERPRPFSVGPAGTTPASPPTEREPARDREPGTPERTGDGPGAVNVDRRTR
jgi:CBS domain-containing protein